MYLLKHLPPELKRRWDDQLALQHDVDIKRLWRRSPQAMDPVIGGPPINATIDWPYDGSASGSDESESDASSDSPSSSSSSGPDCPQCVTIAVSGMAGECSILNRTYHCALSGECSDVDLTYSKSATIEIDGEEHSLNANAWYDRTSERWTGLVAVGPSSATFSSEFGVPLDWEGSLEHETGCDGDATLTHSTDPCPDDSSSSSSSTSSSESSSSANSSSVSESESSESSSSSIESESHNESSSSNDCPHVICSLWGWQSGTWTYLTTYNNCGGEPCTSSCNAVPPASGYAGLYAFRYCDGSIAYVEL